MDEKIVKKPKAKKETFMQGVITVMLSQILIKILGLVYRIYLTNREGFGNEGDGIYSSGYQIYALLLTVSSIGVPNAISKLVSERVAVGDHKGANRIFKIAFATFALLGLIGTLLLFFGAHAIANYWLKIPDAELTLVALSPAIFFVSISSVLRGYFNGRKNLKTTARAQTIEQIFKTALTVVIVELVALGTNTSTKLMAAGANLATTLATFSSFAYLFMYYRLRRKEIGNEIKQTVNYKYERVSKIIKMILAVSIPMTLSSIMSSLNKNIDSVTVSRMLQNYQGQTEKEATANYGIIGGKVDTLTSLPLSINIAFATALVPAIAAAKIKKDMKTATQKTSFSLLVSMIIGLPCTIGMCVYAEQILNLLYPNANQGVLVLQICSFTIIFTILDQTINGALQGFGKVFVPAIALGCGCLTKLVCNLTLLRIPGSGVCGAAIGSVACHMVAFTIAYNVLRKNVKLDLTFSKFVVKPIIATAIMIICSYASFIILNKIMIEKLAFIVAIVIAIIIYLLAIIALKIFTKEEIYALPQGEKIYAILEKMRIY